MPTPFDKLGYPEAAQVVEVANISSAVIGLTVSPIAGSRVIDSSPRSSVGFLGTLAMLRRMLAGDMWLDGLGWMGPRPQPTEDGYAETMALLQQGFVSGNILADVVDRHVAGVLGMEPAWGLTPRQIADPDTGPTPAQQKLIDEAEDLLTEWWDGRKVHKIMLRAVRTLLMARRGPIRLYVPRGKLEPRNVNVNGQLKTVRVVPTPEGDVPAGLSVVWPDDPIPERATVAEDPDTKESVGVALFERGRSVIGLGSIEPFAEISYLTDSSGPDGKPRTIIRQVGTGGQAGAATLTLGGRLPMYEMTREAFITAQMIQLQRAFNLAMSALPRNVITSGWLERVIANAQMPGKWVPDPSKPNGKRWVPDKHTTGGAVTTYLKGLRQDNEATGGITYSTPAVTFREPTPVAPTVEGQEALYRAILREAKQEHVLMSQDIKASGKSREQARYDFEMTLATTAAEVNACGRWIIETALAMAEEFAGRPGQYTRELRATFECQINTGPITSDERTAIDKSVEAGTLSVETAMALEGVQDTDAEMARIAAQPGADLGLRERQLTAVGAAAANGLDVEGAARFVGLDPADARRLVPTIDTTNPGTGDPANPVITGDPTNPGEPTNPAPRRTRRGSRGRGGRQPAASNGNGNGNGGA